MVKIKKVALHMKKSNYLYDSWIFLLELVAGLEPATC